MMGYTHAAIGAGGALALADFLGHTTPDAFLLATVAGAVGGIAPDIDVKDSRKVKDGTRSRIMVFIIAIIGLSLGQLLGYGTLSGMIQRKYAALLGLVIFIALLVAGHFTEHRTFTHSLLFLILTTGCIYSIAPAMTIYYFVGCLLHIVLDMLNNRFNQHGVWLLYPIKTGKGIALGLCKAARLGNKIFYFVGIALYIVAGTWCVMQFYEGQDCIAPAIMSLVVLVTLHYARAKSEKEQRHLMHISGEL